MRLTPLDILQKRFREAKKGLDPEEVHAFLDQARESMEELLRENQGLRDELGRRNADIALLQGDEAELKQTLLLARRVSEDLERGARREADVVVGEARLEAERILIAASDEHRAMQGDIVSLRVNRARLSAELRAIVDTHARLLDELERSFGAS